MIPLFKVAIDPSVPPMISQTMGSGFIGQGPKVDQFERMLESQLQHPVVTVNSATSGLTLALKMLDLKPGTKILTSPLTCTATNWAILANNLVPKWVDLRQIDLNIQRSSLLSKLSEDVGALMVVHWGGNPPDVDLIRHAKWVFREKYGKDLPVIHDLAHAWGSDFRLDAGDQGVYSFQAVKQLTTTDGGALLTPFVERAKKLRWYGIDRDNREGDIAEWGYKYHMNDVAATTGIANFAMSLRNVERNRENAAWYDGFFYGYLTNSFSVVLRSSKSSCWLYTILVENRVDFIRMMKDKGIETSPVHKRNDAYECVAWYREALPILDCIDDKVVCIPVGWWVSDEQREYIAQTIKQGW